MKSSILILFVITLFSSSIVLANGWECVSKEKESDVIVSVVLYNHTKGNTKTPAILRARSEDGKVLVFAGGSDIGMETVKEGEFQKNQNPIPQNKLYTIEQDDLKAPSGTAASKVTLIVNGNQDSEKLAEGQLRSARLKFYSASTDKELDKQRVELACGYYLKGEKKKLDTKEEMQQVQQQQSQQIAKKQIDQAQQQKE